jgi:hypothetical protein
VAVSTTVTTASAGGIETSRTCSEARSRWTPEVFFDLGDYTVTFHVLHGRGQQSGADVATPAAHLCRWKDGLIIYFKGYIHREEVFSDLGIPKETWNRSLARDLSVQDAHADS